MAGDYCFNQLKVQRVTARTHMKKQKVINVMVSAGFRVEGRVRLYYPDGADASCPPCLAMAMVVIRGLEAGWREGSSPWTLTELDGRCYGRGVVDNKGPAHDQPCRLPAGADLAG